MIQGDLRCGGSVAGKPVVQREHQHIGFGSVVWQRKGEYCGVGCLLLKLISVGLPASPKNGLHRGVRRTARSSAENPINFNRRQRWRGLS